MKIKDGLLSIENYLSSNLEKFVKIVIKTICDKFLSRVQGTTTSERWEINEAEIIITEERMELIKSVIDQIRLFIDKKVYKDEHMITGVQGIGKSYSLLLMAHCFKFSEEIRKNFHVVMIAECSLLSKKKWNYVVEQFKIAFPEDPIFSKDIPFEEEMKTLYNLVKNYSKTGKILIIIVDQINWLYGTGESILDMLLSFDWTIKIVSESANNNIKLNKQYESYVWHYYRKMVSEVSVTSIITQESLNYHPSHADFDKILRITKGIPREALLLCMTEGNSLEEKISLYEKKRKTTLGSFMKNSLKTWMLLIMVVY